MNENALYFDQDDWKGSVTLKQYPHIVKGNEYTQISLLIDKEIKEKLKPLLRTDTLPLNLFTHGKIVSKKPRKDLAKVRWKIAIRRAFTEFYPLDDPVLEELQYYPSTSTTKQLT